MILTYLYDLSELNKMGDAIVVSLKNYSFNSSHNFTKEEILDIKSKTDKRVFLSITPLFHDSELEDVKNILESLKNLDGFIFQDLGLIQFFQELDIMDKVVYAPETFITNHIDKEFFSQIGLNKFLLSREITLEDIKMILHFKGDASYMYNAFGYQMLFYSYRHHLSNFKEKFNTIGDLKDNFNIKIKEETRNELYRAIEDNRGFRIYKDKILNAYSDIKDLPIDILLLDRIFIDDDMYFDAIKMFKGEITESTFIEKYNPDSFEKAYLYKETGLLKEDEKNA